MTAKFSLPAVAALALVPIPLACGGDDGPPIKVGSPDAAIDAPYVCKTGSSFTPTFGSGDVVVEDYPSTGSGSDATTHQMYMSAPLNAEDPPDVLYIDLFQDYGVFAGSDIHPGTFTLTGEETAYSTCGACVLVAGDVSQQGTAEWYMASSGILNLTSVMGRLTGSLQNVTLLRVLPGDNGGPGDVVIGDCTTRITQASFDAPIMMGSAARSAAVAPLPRVLRHRRQ